MKSSVILAAALLGLSLGSCHGKRDPEPDPCQSAEANPLRFRILESTGAPTPDTAYSKQDITFEAPGAPYTSYEWQVGNDTRPFTQRRFSLYFANNLIGPLPVRLIARRPPNTRCFPHDDGVDTLTRTLTLLPYGALRPPVYGKFQGSTTDSPRDTFTIRVFQGPDPYNPGGPTPYSFMRNLSRGCQSPYFIVGITWRGLSFNYGGSDYGCQTEIGKGYLTSRDSIRIDYSQFRSGTLERFNRTFLGRRVR